MGYEHMHQLPYVVAVIDEILRMHPPAIWTNRALEEDIDLDGIVMCKGQVIFIPVVAVHRSPVNWVAPNEFRPERFLDEDSGLRGAHIPFGAGRRVCPGYRLAPFELRVALATFALRGMHVSREASDPLPNIRA